ncbi:MAG: hypothetical protein LBH84_01450 [Prevotellaceae bacterium]|jgi:hypothetical protein|nr:hypothetical protein [Prevotellaceae bacterium]
MKNIAKSACALLLLGACINDKGNYEYHDVNSITISGINDAVNDPPYLVSVGDYLNITPTLEFLLGEERDTYRYEWHQMYGLAAPYQTVRLLSEERNLSLEIEGSMRQPGIYYLMYCVTNLTTGIRYDHVFRVMVQNRISRGYVVLHEPSDASFNIDLIASFNDTLTHYHNLLNIFESGLPKTGRKPLDLLCYYDRTAPSPYDTDERLPYSVWVLTDKSTDRVKTEDFSYMPDYNVSKLSLIPAGMFGSKELVAEKMVTSVVGENPNSARVYMYFNGSWFFFNLAYTVYFFDQPLNVFPDDLTATPYKASPYIMPVSYFGAIMFDEDQKCFTLHQTNNSDMYTSSKIYCSHKIASSEPYFPWGSKGYNLLYMGNRTWNNGFAVVENTDSSTCALLQMTVERNVGARQLARSFFDPSLDMRSVKFFAYHPTLPYLYCATEERVYKILVSTMSVTDVTDQLVPQGHRISVMEFLFVRAPRSGLLTLATYDPNGKAGENGELAFYAAANGTGDLSLAKHPASPTGNGYQVDMKWKGFGKIVALDYKQE